MPTAKPTGNFKDLVVRQKAMVVAQGVYAFTARFPSEEKFGLVSQMRRAAVPIPSNIAESQARHTTGEFGQFISHAEGSVAELATQLLLCLKLGFAISEYTQPAVALLNEVRRMLNALRRSLVTRP